MHKNAVTDTFSRFPPENNGLNYQEDEVTWSTRTWQALMAQRMSVSLHLAVAWEIAVELKGVGAEEDEAALFGAAASGA